MKTVCELCGLLIGDEYINKVPFVLKVAGKKRLLCGLCVRDLKKMSNSSRIAYVKRNTKSLTR